MEKITFNIRTNDGKLEQRQGYAVELPEYPDLKLACNKYYGAWRITEIRTGGLFDCCSLKKEVVKTAIDRINIMGIDRIREHIERSLEEFTKLGYKPVEEICKMEIL